MAIAPDLPDTRAACEARDATDPLAHHRGQFQLPDGIIYLDGNSLGPLPRATVERVRTAMVDDWGRSLIGSWNSAGWMDLPARVGNKIARLVGAADGEVIAADSTSVNLFKALSGAVAMRPQRSVILSEHGNFPTDLYMAQGLIRQLGGRHELRLVGREELPGAITDDVAVVMLTQVDYRDGSRLPMAEVTAAAHEAGALTLWDLAHSAGAIPVDLAGARADLAVGCCYKYLNGGPGATAFLYVAKRHQQAFFQPLAGWHGHAAPFEFQAQYQPAPGIARALCGTPPVLALVATECGIDTVLAAEDEGGLVALCAKANVLLDIFAAQVAQRCGSHGVRCITPTDAVQRGSQVSFTLDDGDQAYAVVQAMIARGVIGDFRAPNVMRFGFAPLYLRHVDAFDAAAVMADVLDSGQWRQPQFLERRAVT